MNLLTGADHELVRKAKQSFLDKEVGPSPCHCMVFAVFEGKEEDFNIPNANIWVQDSPFGFPFVFISFPSTRDMNWKTRHPNQVVCELIVETDYETFANLPDEEYQKRKGECADRMLKELYRQLPRLENKIDFKVSSTPRTAERFLGSQHGCDYGVAATPSKFRANREWLRPTTPIKNLYLAGQDVVSCGLCGGMFGGLMAACCASSRCLMQARELMYPFSKL